MTGEIVDKDTVMESIIVSNGYQITPNGWPIKKHKTMFKNIWRYLSDETTDVGPELQGIPLYLLEEWRGQLQTATTELYITHHQKDTLTQIKKMIKKINK